MGGGGGGRHRWSYCKEKWQVESGHGHGVTRGGVTMRRSGARPGFGGVAELLGVCERQQLFGASMMATWTVTPGRSAAICRLEMIGARWLSLILQISRAVYNLKPGTGPTGARTIICPSTEDSNLSQSLICKLMSINASYHNIILYTTTLPL